jgi:primary-amine oxidase
MTDIATPATVTAHAAGAHPLASLTATEIDLVRETLARAGELVETDRIVYLGLVEPHKRDVLDGIATGRLARVMVLDISDGRSRDIVVDVLGASIQSIDIVDGADGRLAILNADFAAVPEILAADPRWRDALAERGLTNDQVRSVPLSAGNFGIPDEERRRVVRVLAFEQEGPQDHPWAHPVGGLCAHIDLDAREVISLVDERVFPRAEESGNFDDPDLVGPMLEGLKPISITQPDGPSFRIEDGEITWANWRLRVSFDQREGLVLHQVGFRDEHEHRPILYRGSIAEMVVPYGDPSPVRFWQNYFDLGEYLFGRYANSLELGCDCVGEIAYLDAVLADEFGRPRVIPNAICIHEEDFGTLWKHTDGFTGSQEVRRQRRLVISFFTTVGNYDYGFYWYLYLDGTIECEAKLTGVLFTSTYPEEGSDYQSQVAPGLGAPYHQHLFCARLDMTVDGVANEVDELDAVRVPAGDGNPWGNAFTQSAMPLRTELSAIRDADQSKGRAWRVSSTSRRTRMGEPTSYILYPSPGPTLLADETSSIASRAAYARHHLWVTAYDPEQRYPAGDFVNQSRGGLGLPQYVADDASLEGADVVLWHTFGPTHFPRVEDWPVMPVDYARFTLKPHGFFERNPALNVPPSESHCHAPAATSSAATADGGDSGACHHGQ